MKPPVIPMSLMRLVPDCKKSAERYSGDEVFGMPATLTAGTTTRNWSRFRHPDYWSFEARRFPR